MSFALAKTLTLLARDVYASALYPLARWLLRSQSRDRLLILTFHRVLPDRLRTQYPLPGLAVTPSELRWVLEAVGHHFEILTVSDAVGALRGSLNQKPLLAITFDDGQWDNYEFALPVLESLNMVGTFYIPTGKIGTAELLWHDLAAFWWANIGRIDGAHSIVPHPDLSAATSPGAFLSRLKALSVDKRKEVLSVIHSEVHAKVPKWARLMTWDEVGDVTRRGHEVGAHAVSHEILPQLTREQQRAEIVGSRLEIEQRTGIAPKSFCYPNGSFDEGTKLIVKESGYTTASGTRWGVNTVDQDSYELLRCDMDARRFLNRSGALSIQRVAMKIVGLQPGL